MALPLDELLKLKPYFEHPCRVSVRRFADDVIARCWVDRPKHTVADVAALAPSRRRKMLGNVVTVNGHAETWKALRGSHLTMDERLYAVMYWKWETTDRLAVRMRERFREREAAGVFEGTLGTAISGISTTAEFELGVVNLTSGKPILSGLIAAPKPPALSWSEHVFQHQNALAEGTLHTAGLVDSKHAAMLAGSLASKAFGGVAGSLKAMDALKAVAMPTGVAQAMAKATAMTFPASRLARSASLAAVIDPGVMKVAMSLAGVTDVASLTAQALKATPQMLKATQYAGGIVQGPGYAAALAGGPVVTGLGAAAIDMGVASAWDKSIVGLIGTTSIADAFAQNSTITQWLKDASISEELLKRFREGAAKVDRVRAKWGNRRLGYLASGLLFVADDASLLVLDHMSEAEAVGVFLTMLETVTRDGELIAEMREAVVKTPYMNAAHRESLDSFLEHLADRKWVLACNDMYSPLEGIFWEVAFDRKLAERDEQLSDQRKARKKFDTTVKALLKNEPGFATWITRALYGTQGNAFRHGSAVTGHREKALFGLVALAGWLQNFAGTDSLDSLIDRAYPHLPAAQERLQLTEAVPPVSV